MRIHLVAALALVLPACAGDITSPGGNTGGAACGNGVVDTGEQCDDGNTAAGDGCSATCTTEQVVTPHVSLSVDKPTVTTDLNVETDIIVTATSEMGFAGTVTLAVDAKDSSNASITDWTDTLDQTSLTLTAGGTATATLKLSALGDTAALAGNATITATGAQTPGTATVAVTFNPVLSVTFNDDGAGNCVYPTTHHLNDPYAVKVGRMIKVIDGSTTKPFTVHVDPGFNGFPHESGTTAAGSAYTGAFTIDDFNNTNGIPLSFYCHNGNAGTMIDPGTATQDRPYVKVVQ